MRFFTFFDLLFGSSANSFSLNVLELKGAICDLKVLCTPPRASTPQPGCHTPLSTAGGSSYSPAAPQKMVIKVISHLTSLFFSHLSQQVCLFGDVYINEITMRKAKLAVKAQGNSKASCNSAVAIILESLYQNEELALRSISGKACPSIPGAEAKGALPKDLVEAITSAYLNKASHINSTVL